MGRPPNTQQRRRQIVKAMMQVIAAQGYAGASIADIAAEARLASGLIHYHFSDKLEILLCLLDELVQSHLSALDVRLASARNNPPRELRHFIDAHLALPGKGVAGMPTVFLKSPPAAVLKALRSPWIPGGSVAVKCWVAIGAEAVREPEVRRAYGAAVRALSEKLAGIIRRGVADGDFRCAHPPEAAAAIMAAILGMFAMDASVPGGIPRGSAAKSVLAMAEGLLSVEDSR